MVEQNQVQGCSTVLPSEAPRYTVHIDKKELLTRSPVNGGEWRKRPRNNFPI